MTSVDSARHLLLTQERRLIAIRRATVSDQQTKHKRIEEVRKQQDSVVNRVKSLGLSYWQQQEPTRRHLLRDYLGILETAKLVTDDVFVEALHQSRLAQNNEQLGKARDVYQHTLVNWARGHPLLYPPTAKGPRGFFTDPLDEEPPGAFIKMPRNHLGLPPFLRQLRASLDGDRFWYPTTEGVVGFRTHVRQVVDTELRAIRRDLSIEAFTPETVHLLGLLYLRAQLELRGWTAKDTVDRQSVEDWYRATTFLVEQLREDVLDVLGLPVRQALVTGDVQLAARLADVEKRYLRDLTQIYSVRNLDTAVLFAYFVRAPGGKFATEAEAVGVNETVEAISEYAGNPNPDHQSIGDFKTVDGLLTSAEELRGKRVRVVGVFHAADSTVSSATSSQRVGVELEYPRFARLFNGRNRHVVVDGTFTEPTAPAILNASIEPWSIFYVSNVGSPLRKDQPDTGVLLQLAPRWRSHTDALERESLLELEDTSLPETLRGQQAAIGDVMRRPEVVRLFAGPLASSERATLDLTDVATRSKIWRTIFAGLVRTSQDTALDDFFPLLQQYLTSHTRHTYLNMRDSGRSYLDSSWPTDITGSSFYDCGVYAMQIARDLHAAVHSSPVAIELRFVTFLNHVCLIGYVGQKAFLANNATLYLPQSPPKVAGQSSRDWQVDAAGYWAGRAFGTVHRVRYTIFPVTIPRFGVTTSLGEMVFRKRLWSVFLRSIGWGIVSNGAGEYFEAIRRFNRRSVALRAILNQDAGKQDLTRAAKIALDLYELARKLSGIRPGPPGSRYLVLERRFPPENYYTALGWYAAGPGEQLPMWDLVNLLQGHPESNLTEEQRLLIERPVAGAHIDELRRALEGGSGR
ncbi:hypothetical protein [Streptomyces phaeochromogenes]